MATDGPTPPPCSQELMDNGTDVLHTHTIPPNAFEGWLAKVREKCGQQIDWHYVGGRIRVLALGDLGKVRAALEELKPEHDLLYQDVLMKKLNIPANELEHYPPPWRIPTDDED